MPPPLGATVNGTHGTSNGTTQKSETPSSGSSTATREAGSGASVAPQSKRTTESQWSNRPTDDELMSRMSDPDDEPSSSDTDDSYETDQPAAKKEEDPDDAILRKHLGSSDEDEDGDTETDEDSDAGTSTEASDADDLDIDALELDSKANAAAAKLRRNGVKAATIKHLLATDKAALVAMAGGGEPGEAKAAGDKQPAPSAFDDTEIEAALAEPLRAIEEMYDADTAKQYGAVQKAALKHVHKAMEQQFTRMSGVVKSLMKVIENVDFDMNRSALVSEFPGITDDSKFESIKDEMDTLAQARDAKGKPKFTRVQDLMKAAARNVFANETKEERAVANYKKHAQRTNGTPTPVKQNTRAAGPREVTKDQWLSMVFDLTEAGKGQAEVEAWRKKHNIRIKKA